MYSVPVSLDLNALHVRGIVDGAGALDKLVRSAKALVASPEGQPVTPQGRHVHALGVPDVCLQPLRMRGLLLVIRPQISLPPPMPPGQLLRGHGSGGGDDFLGNTHYCR